MAEHDNPQPSPDTGEDKVELPQTPEELADYKRRTQAEVIRAMTDSIGNSIAIAIGNRELRNYGIGEDVPTADEDLNTILDRLEGLNTNLHAANLYLKKGKDLPIIDDGAGPMADFKRTNYTELGNEDDK